jgi:hypothetical protein
MCEPDDASAQRIAAELSRHTIDLLLGRKLEVGS